MSTTTTSVSRVSREAWALDHITRLTEELDALGDSVTPAAQVQIAGNVESLRSGIRREKELGAAGHWWCVTTDTGLHLAVPHGPRDNGGFGPVTVWDGQGFVGVTARAHAHPDGWCEHGGVAGEWRTV